MQSRLKTYKRSDVHTVGCMHMQLLCVCWAGERGPRTRHTAKKAVMFVLSELPTISYERSDVHTVGCTMHMQLLCVCWAGAHTQEGRTVPRISYNMCVVIVLLLSCLGLGLGLSCNIFCVKLQHTAINRPYDYTQPDYKPNRNRLFHCMLWTMYLC